MGKLFSCFASRNRSRSRSAANPGLAQGVNESRSRPFIWGPEVPSGRCIEDFRVFDEPSQIRSTKNSAYKTTRPQRVSNIANRLSRRSPPLHPGRMLYMQAVIVMAPDARGKLEWVLPLVSRRPGWDCFLGSCPSVTLSLCLSSEPLLGPRPSATMRAPQKTLGLACQASQILRPAHWQPDEPASRDASISYVGNRLG
ncbi:hypothetical protein GQ53DRAFT_211734 [Thozetella sp. PMI_491]|nr:hypothetical protein GQ53DRAFT_211734 [Thozetella sp. PMI_491]